MGESKGRRRKMSGEAKPAVKAGGVRITQNKHAKAKSNNVTEEHHETPKSNVVTAFQTPTEVVMHTDGSELANKKQGKNANAPSTKHQPLPTHQKPHKEVKHHVQQPRSAGQGN